MSWIESVARENIVRLNAYRSARSIATDAAVFLDANEAPGPVAEDMNRYPNPQPAELVKRFAEVYGVPADRILVGRGSDEAIDILTRTFCEPAKDAILITPPTYGMYEVAAGIQNARVVRVPLLQNQNDWSLDTDAMGRAIREDGVKLTYLCSPNNPTGSIFAKEDIRRICRFADRSLVVIDEAYNEFAPEASCLSLLSEFRQVVVLRTLSKAWAQAGLRCGVAIGDPEVIRLLQKVRAPYPVPRPVADLALAALADPSVMTARVQVLKRERQRIERALRELTCVQEVFASHANFLLVRFTDEATVMSAMRGAGILLRSRHGEVGLKNCVRITIGNEAENDLLLKTLGEMKIP